MSSSTTDNVYDQQALNAAREYYKNNPEATVGGSDFYGGVITNKETGESIGYATSDMMKKLPAGGGTVYQNPDTGKWYTSKISAIPAPTITMDKETGKIKIRAPQAVLDTETFKKNFLDNSSLQMISKAQQMSPDYKFTYYDDNGVKQVSTPQTELDKFSDALKDLASEVKDVETNLRPIAARQTTKEIADKMTIEQLSTAYTPTYNQGDISVTDTTRISVPNFIEGIGGLNYFTEALKKLDSWDESTRTVERGELFKELYNRDHFNAEQVEEFQTILRTRMENAYINDGDAVFDGDDLAKTIQLYNFIEHEDPSANWLQVTGDVASGLIGGIISGVASASVDLYNTIEGVTNDVIKLGVSSATFGQVGFGGEGPLTLVKDTREGWEDWKEFRNDQLALVSDTAATTRKIAEVGSHLAANIYIGAKLGGAFGEVAKEAVVGSKTVEGIALGFDTAKVAASAAKTTEDLVAGIRAATKVGDIVKMTEGAIKTQKAIGGFVGTSVDILTQGVIDAAMTDPETMRKLLDGDGDGESYKYLMEQFAWNAGGWAAGVATAKGITKVGNTKAGRVANAAWSKTMGAFTAKVGDSVYSLKSKLVGEDLIQHLTNKLAEETAQHGGSATKKASNLGEKLKIQEERQKLREAKKAFDMDIKVNELSGDGLKAAEDYMNQIRGIQNAIDDMHRSLSFRVSTYLNTKINPAIAAADQGIRKSLEKVAKIEKLDGLRKTGKVAKEGIVMLTDDSVQYLNNVFMAKKMSNAVEAGGELAESAAKHVDEHVDAIKKFRETHSEELVAALDEVLPKYTAFYDAFNEYAVAHGLKNMSMTEGMRQGALFNDEYGYIRVQHDKTASYAMNRLDGQVKNKTIYDFQHYEFGDPGDYVDLELVRFQHMYDMAATERSQHFVKTLFDSGAAEKQVVMGGDMVEKIRKVSGAKKTFQTTATESAKYIGDNIDFSSALGKSMGVTKGSTKTAKGWTPRVYKSDRATYIYSLSPTEVTKGIKEIGYESGSVFKDINVAVEAADDGEAVFKEIVDALPDNAKKFLKGKMQTIGGGDDYSAFQKLNKDLGSTFEADFNRVLLSDTPSFRDSDAIKKAVIDQKKAAQAVVDEKLIRTPNTDKFGQGLNDSISDSVDDYVKNASENWSSESMVEAMTDDAAGLDSDTVSRYIALDELKKSKNMNAAYESIDENIDEMVKGKGMSTDDVDALKEQAHKSFKEKVESEYNSISDTMRDAGSSLYDTDKWYDDVKKAKKDLKDYTEADNVIVVQNEKGEYEYVKTDPVTADLYNYRPRGTGGDEGAIAKVNRALSRTFRLGTTTANLKSLANQYFRDTGNALFVGNAWQTVSSAADDMVDVFGERIVQELKTFDPYGMTQVERLAEETGESLEKAAISRELEMGRALSPASTEVELYNRVRKNIYNKSLKRNRDAMDGVEDATNKVISALDKPNEIREVYLRNRVFANNFNDALKKGYTVAQAREYAQFAMNNATTNFGRQLYHLRNIANSTPYFSAAINGTTSFWRMFELDPVGITSRIMGGLILPTMYLTGMSLADEKNREVYKNLPEYAKDDNITFVTDGQVYQIPIPQELGSIIAPFRQFVEYLNDSNKNNFWELMLNDALGLSPVDLQGFSTIDMDQMMSDPTFFDRISRGTARIFSQMAPVPVKGAYMFATGTDPYTGKNLRDPSYCYYDAELGQVVTMDYNQSQTSSFLAQMFPNSNAAVMEKVLSGVFGQTGMDVIDSVVGLGQMVAGDEKGKEFFSNLAEKQLTGMSKSFHEDTYNQTNAVWKRSLATLQKEKDAIQNDDEFKQINSALSQETDPEKRKKLLAQRRDLTDAFNEKVKNTIDGLKNKYGGTLDRYKFAAVLALLNFDNGSGYTSKDPVLSEQSSQDYYAGRAQAIEALQKMGVRGTDDLSIFGYITKNKITGEVTVKYSTPVQILDAGNKIWNAAKIDTVNIKNILDSDDLKTQKKAMQSQIDAIYGKDKLRNNDYDKIDALKIEYNNQVIAKLSPYIEDVSPGAILNNQDIMDILENQIQVPSAYEKVKGRFVSSGNGKLNKQQGFVRSYIKKVFKDLYEKEQ